MSGVTGLNVSGTNLGNGVSTVASKPIDNTSSQKPAEKNDKKMSTGMKVGIGAVAVAASVIAGIAIKNKVAMKSLEKATKELENAAKKVGLDVKSYMAAKKASANGVSKIEKINYEDIYNKVQELADKGIIQKDDTLSLIPGKGLRKMFKDNKDYKDFPENAIGFVIRRGDKMLHGETIVYDSLGDSLLDFVGDAFKKGNVYVKRIGEL